MQFILILVVVMGGMGLSVEAGLLGPLGAEVGELWATFSVFSVGAALTFILMLFFSPRNSPSFFTQPSWTLLGGVFGAGLCCHFDHSNTGDWYCDDDDRYSDGTNSEKFIDRAL